MIDQPSRTLLHKDQQMQLTAPIWKEEISLGICNIANLKAPSRDGFNDHFFNMTWTTVGSDILEVVMQFFNTNWMYKEIIAPLLLRYLRYTTPYPLNNSDLSHVVLLYKIISNF